MKTYGLVGFPLAHSFSRKFFTEKFEHEGIDAEYRNFEIDSIARFPSIFESVEEMGGLNVTIPYKEQIIPFMKSMDDAAAAIGAVNTIKVTEVDGYPALRGYNTDVIGFTQSIQPMLKPHHQKALVLGTGGASKAVVYALEKLGLDVAMVSRTKAEGQLTYAELTATVMENYTVIVNATPLGTYPGVDGCPAIPYQWVTPQHLFHDLVYNPEKPLFLERAEKQGADIKNGLDMLHGQALAAWAIWNAED